MVDVLPKEIKPIFLIEFVVTFEVNIPTSKDLVHRALHVIREAITKTHCGITVLNYGS